MFSQILPSPQVNRCANIAYKHGIYKFPHELQNDFRLQTWEISTSLGRA